MTLGQRIRELRLLVGITQAQLAARIGGRCSDTLIGHYEADRSVPSTRRTRQIADALGVEWTQLFEGVE